MSVFDQCYLLLNHPNGGVEDLDRMRPYFDGVFCNVGDHPPEAWEYIVRPRAQAQGMFCGPWLHTRAADGSFSRAKLEQLIEIADDWHSPLIINSEKEIDQSGNAITRIIRDAIGDRDGAISTEAWLYNPPSVDWTPLADVPFALQIFPEQPDWPSNDPAGCKQHAHDCGIRCVYYTFGSYGALGPDLYELRAPYSIFTGDNCDGDYEAWGPLSDGFQACQNTTNGGEEVVVPGKGAATSADQAFEHWYDSSARPSDWRRDNPGEWADLQAYRGAVSGTPPPTTIKSHTGMMLLELIEARRYAEGSHA